MYLIRILKRSPHFGICTAPSFLPEFGFNMLARSICTNATLRRKLNVSRNGNRFAEFNFFLKICRFSFPVSVSWLQQSSWYITTGSNNLRDVYLTKHSAYIIESINIPVDHITGTCLLHLHHILLIPNQRQRYCPGICGSFSGNIESDLLQHEPAKGLAGEFHEICLYSPSSTRGSVRIAGG